MRTREEILLDMVENMPIEISSATKPYLMEAMEIYANEYYQNKLKLLGISGVVLQSEQLTCYTCHYIKGDKPKGENYCSMCNHYF